MHVQSCICKIIACFFNRFLKLLALVEPKPCREAQKLRRAKETRKYMLCWEPRTSTPTSTIVVKVMQHLRWSYQEFNLTWGTEATPGLERRAVIVQRLSWREKSLLLILVKNCRIGTASFWKITACLPHVFLPGRHVVPHYFQKILHLDIAFENWKDF